MALVTPTHAIVRPPSASYATCIRTDAHTAIDVVLAQEQHAGYVAALREAGVIVDELPALDSSPDATFVEDTAVVLDTCAVITRPGARARRAEVVSVAAALDRRRALTVMTPPGTLDGGDVMRIGPLLVVGLSQRTDREGARALAEVAAHDDIAVVTVEVPSGLHLKSACSIASASLVVVHGLLVAPLRAAIGASIELLEVPEVAGANVLGFADRVLVSTAAPRTAALLEARGLTTRAIALSQLHLGDGALSCLSLRWVDTGSGDWVV